MPLTVSGAQNGDVLILTRPIGSGVIMAAAMQGAAKGQDVADALTVMTTAQQPEAEVLGPVAHAMTDVTGFGLAGHVRAIARASELDAAVRAAGVPLYAGARALSDAGVSSTLMPANRADAAVEGVDDPLLFDPQTAGGLLAAVPADRAAEVLVALDARGCKGHVIGQLTQGCGKVIVT